MPVVLVGRLDLDEHPILACPTASWTSHFIGRKQAAAAIALAFGGIGHTAAVTTKGFGFNFSGDQGGFST